MEDEYCMNKKKLTDIFKDEYLPLYHVRMTPYLILQALAQYKCIKKVNKDTPELVLFKASKVQEIVSSHGGRVQGNRISSYLLNIYHTNQFVLSQLWNILRFLTPKLFELCEFFFNYAVSCGIRE